MNTQYGNLEYHIDELLSKNYFSRYKYQLSYLAKYKTHQRRRTYNSQMGKNQILTIITLMKIIQFITH